MKSNPVYLDYNATAPLRPEARERIIALMSAPHNASSVHRYGREGRKQVEAARDILGKLVNTPAAQVIFNSGATEGNNTVLKYFAHTYPDERVLISDIEHASVFEVLDGAERIKVTPKGTLDLDHLEYLLSQSPKVCLVSVMMVNNETGVIQPVKEISSIVHKHGALLHCDAVQAAGRIDIDMSDMGINFLTLSAHKLGGPQGVGALALGLCGITPMLIEGGGQEKMARGGTENVAGIAGFGAAAELAMDQKAYQDLCAPLQKALEDGIQGISPDIVIFGHDTPRVSNTTMFAAPGLKSETLLMNFDLEGVCISNGSACSSGTVQASHVLKAMGASDVEAAGALRISIGWATQESDIDAFLEVCESIYQRMKK